MVTEHAEGDSEGQMELPDEDEEDLCKVWDMAMDKVTFCHLFYRNEGTHSAFNKLNEF